MRWTLFALFGAIFFISVVLVRIEHLQVEWCLLTGAIWAVGFYDVLQRRHTILRNFPVVGHFRFWLEALRPEIQQYFVESDISGDPIARIFRNVVYQRA